MNLNRLRTVNWSNNSYPTGVVKPVYETSMYISLHVLNDSGKYKEI